MANDKTQTSPAPAPAVPPHTAWLRWSADQQKQGKLPDLVLDVPLTLRRGLTIWQGPNEGQQIHGPKTDMQMSLDAAYANKQKFDEWGRIVELKERRDVIRSEWVRSRDRAIDPVPSIQARVAAWSAEDGDRVAAGTLAVGPVVCSGRKYRDPNPGERVPAEHLAKIADLASRDSRTNMARLVELVRVLAGGASGAAKAS